MARRSRFAPTPTKTAGRGTATTISYYFTSTHAGRGMPRPAYLPATRITPKFNNSASKRVKRHEEIHYLRHARLRWVDAVDGPIGAGRHQRTAHSTPDHSRDPADQHGQDAAVFR